ALKPCPCHRWCYDRHGALCDSCSGPGRLAYLPVEEAAAWRPPPGSVAVAFADLPPVPPDAPREDPSYRWKP
ncbi:MAG TPA: hypothetical protein VJ739_00925, partial [Gemmataceae bacterium]|nr:hypothetical protein [Gemmataceae bacterium]